MNGVLMFTMAAMFSAAVVWPNEIKAKAQSISEFFMDESGKRMSKLEATKELIVDGTASVYRCYEVEMSDKLTLRKRKTP